MKTCELQGAALDWAVEVALLSDRIKNVDQRAAIASRNRRVSEVGYTTDWSQGGPIIERERMQFRSEQRIQYRAFIGLHGAEGVGPTHLIAAMRCYCCAILGDEIEIPQELQPCQQPNL